MWFIGARLGNCCLCHCYCLCLCLTLSLSCSASAIVHAVSFTGAVLLFKLPLYILVRLSQGRRVASFTLPGTACACVLLLALSSLLFSCCWRFYVLSHRRFIYCCSLLGWCCCCYCPRSRPSNLIAVNIFSIFEKRLPRLSKLQQEKREREYETLSYATALQRCQLRPQCCAFSLERDQQCCQLRSNLIYIIRRFIIFINLMSKMNGYANYSLFKILLLKY